MKAAFVVALLCLCAGSANAMSPVQLTIGKLHKSCEATSPADGVACHQYILSHVWGAINGPSRNSIGGPICLPEGISDAAIIAQAEAALTSDLDAHHEDYANAPAPGRPNAEHFIIDWAMKAYPCGHNERP
jgi:hypothetical protein